MKNLSCIFLLCLFGCAQQMTQSEIRSLETREMDVSYDKAYESAVNGLFALGYTVEHTDKTSGVVSGKNKDPRTGERALNTLLFGVVGAISTKEREQSVTFMVTRVQPERTLLRMKLIVDGKSVTDRIIMTKIWQQVEKEALLTEAFTGGPSTKPSSTKPSK